MPTMEPALERCFQCNEVGGPLLACDDDLNHIKYHKGGPKPSFCNNCMIGKKVKVFWPVDQSWYIGTVIAFDPSTGEHELRYPDDDTEWVKIGDIISAAAAGGGGSANTTIATTESSSLGGGVVPLTPVNMGRGGVLQRQAPPSHHPGQSPARVGPPHHPTQHHPDHHQIPSEVDNSSPEYRNPSSSILGPPPQYYGGQYPPGGAGSHYSSQPAPPSGMNMAGPPSYPTSGPPSASQQPQGGGPPSLHHPSMPPPPMVHYGMYPPPGAPGAYGGGPMFPSHPHMGGPPPYGMPPGAMPPYYQGRGGTGSPPTVREDDEHKEGNIESGGGGRSRKTGPKPWTKEEDTLLLNLVHTMQWPMKWTIVAQSLTDRTGKQCRERYVNHLNPRLKASDWNPVEDSTIFHLYNTIGSHWAKMSKIIPGRTDNGIKNRFHNIRRQYEREDSHRSRLSFAEDFPDEIRLDRLRKFPEHLEGKSTQLWDMKGSIGVLAAQTILGGSGSSNNNVNRISANVGNTMRFGPFRLAKVDDVELCVRCGLIVPSLHTGSEICTKTGWCQSCTRIPPNISGNLLRECLNLRRAESVDVRDLIEAFEEYFTPDEDNAWPYTKSNMKSGGGGTKEDDYNAEQEEKDTVGEEVDS